MNGLVGEPVLGGGSPPRWQRGGSRDREVFRDRGGESEKKEKRLFGRGEKLVTKKKAHLYWAFSKSKREKEKDVKPGGRGFLGRTRRRSYIENGCLSRKGLEGKQWVARQPN